ncbi:MAG: hypothetical protein WBM54_03685 [Woeseia sp.]
MKTLLLTGILLLAACGSANDENSKAPEAAPFDDLTGTIDKANAVELELQEQKERMDRALREAEEATEPQP